MFGSAHDEEYYLGFSKSEVVKNESDIDLLANHLLNNFSFLTWELVASAVPVIRNTGGARAFVGSRGSSVDTTFGDSGEDAASYGFPPSLAYVFNLTNRAEGGTYIPLRPQRNAVPYVCG